MKMVRVLCAAGVVALIALPSRAAETPKPADYGCEDAEAIIAAGGRLEPGRWYVNWKPCKQFAEANGIPVVFIWSNAKCVHCKYTDYTFLRPEYLDWKEKNDAGQVIYCYMANGHDLNGKTYDQKGSEAYNWMWKGEGKTINAFPFVVLWWKVDGKVKANVRMCGDDFCAYASGKSIAMTEESYPDRVINVTERISKAFAGWHPVPPYAGGYFSQTNYPYASPQAEEGTTFVDVELVRTSLLETNQQMRISAPGRTPEEVTIDWGLGQVAQTNRIDSFNEKWFAEDSKVTLELLNDGKDGEEVVSTLEIECRTPENSVVNPKWIGKSFDFGEWTMDLEAAKAKVRQEAGDNVWTLVCIQGSQWCPDCGNVEKNFLGVTDERGDNRFQAWATDNKKVALVAIDIPNFGDSKLERVPPEEAPDVEGKYTACLLKRDARLGSPDGEEHLRSGLGYLTRKMVSDDDAKEVLDRNHDLVVKNTDEGGFHRPEDTNAYRTGVPIFVLLRKDGTVAARLTRMAVSSPKDSKNFDNILKRFDEMIEIARNNETEIENNYASDSNTLTLKANGGKHTAQLSHVDQVDVFRLVGASGNAEQSVSVTGASSAEVIVSFVTVGADGKEVELAKSPVTKLSPGVTLNCAFETSGTYYVKVAAASVTAPEFALESSKSTFQSYTVSANLIAVPHEDKATVTPPSGEQSVKVRLVENTAANPVVYKFAGMAGTGCDQLQEVAGHPGFYTATASGDFDIKLASVDGELEYQVWNSGSVEFGATAREVTESVCDESGSPLSISVQRLGGKSGFVKARVTIDESEGATTFEKGRYWLVNTNELGVVELDWEDGKLGEKTAELYIDDDLFYDGTSKVTLRVEVVDSEAGDVRVAEGRDVFTLTITEDDKQSPGKVFVTHAEPAYAHKSIVYMRETEGAKLYATRTEGFDGLVAAVVGSSVKDTVFTTEDPRDLEAIEKEYPGIAELAPALKDAKFLWWSSRESKEKWVKVSGIPAGKTATVKFAPVGKLRGVAASNTVTVVSVRDDAPGFVHTEEVLTFVRYAQGHETVAVDPGTLKGGVLSFSKVSGTLPAGLKVGVEGSSLVVSGIATAKAGVYEPVYQVREKRDKTVVPGLVVRLRLTIVDPTTRNDADPSAPYNPYAAKSRTFKNIPVFDFADHELVGLLQLTVPPTGRASAKFACADGTFSYSAKSWNGCDDSGMLSATLAATRGEGTLEVEARADGSVRALFQGDAFEGLEASVESDSWSRQAPATDWKGVYTAALQQDILISEDQPGIAPTGSGYLSFKMNTTTATYSGTFTVAGMLANGSRFSGSVVLTRQGDETYLPIFKKGTKELISMAIGVQPLAQQSEKRDCVSSVDWCKAGWIHAESAKARGSYELRLKCLGSYYDKNEDLGGCCAATYHSDELDFKVGENVLAEIKVGENTITVKDKNSTSKNPYKLSLSFNRTTGVVQGTFTHPDINKRVSYAGIVVNGRAPCAEGCNPGSEGVPFVSGSCYWTEGSPRLTKGDPIVIEK